MNIFDKVKLKKNKKKIVDFFKEQEAEGKLAILNTGKDCLHILTRGYFVYFEIKSDRGTQHPYQIEMQSKVEGAGGYYYVVRDIEEVMNIINFFYLQKDIGRVC